ncbi:MAG: hypothetical protein LBU45_07155 [Azoarcus sp.]|nr:hypothetical protein [Azoarcus sp.]
MPHLVGESSTEIYCRPVCKSRLPKEDYYHVHVLHNAHRVALGRNQAGE